MYGCMRPVSPLPSVLTSGILDFMRKISAKPGKPIRVALLAADRLSCFEFAIAAEFFRGGPGTLGVPWYDLTVCSVTPGPVSTGSGFSVLAGGTLDDVRSADTVIVPPMEGELDPRLLDAIRAAHRRGARLASLCTGAFVLAQAGVLNGLRATTHWSAAEDLAREFREIDVDPKVLYVDTGQVLTSAGAASSIDLCLHMVRSDYGSEVANSIARRLVVPPHRAGGQAQYIAAPVQEESEGETLAATLEWAQEHLDQELTVESLARRAAMSPRTFARRFTDATGTSPHRWLCRQRVLLAQRLLETTGLSVEMIAQRAGLGTATNLRIHFREELGVSPLSYRRTFRQEPAA